MALACASPEQRGSLLRERREVFATRARTAVQVVQAAQRVRAYLDPREAVPVALRLPRGFGHGVRVLHLPSNRVAIDKLVAWIGGTPPPAAADFVEPGGLTPGAPLRLSASSGDLDALCDDPNTPFVRLRIGGFNDARDEYYVIEPCDAGWGLEPGVTGRPLQPRDGTTLVEALCLRLPALDHPSSLLLRPAACDEARVVRAYELNDEYVTIDAAPAHLPPPLRRRLTVTRKHFKDIPALWYEALATEAELLRACGDAPSIGDEVCGPCCLPYLALPPPSYFTLLYPTSPYLALLSKHTVVTP